MRKMIPKAEKQMPVKTKFMQVLVHFYEHGRRIVIQSNRGPIEVMACPLREIWSEVYGDVTAQTVVNALERHKARGRVGRLVAENRLNNLWYLTPTGLNYITEVRKFV